MRRYLLLGGAAVLVIIVAGKAALAQSPSAPPPTPAQIIRARQAAYEMSVVTFSQLKRAVDTGSDVTKQKFAADALAGWAAALPTLYPDGTGPGQTAAVTGALVEVWINRSGFLTRANAYRAATAKLVDAAKAGDAAAFATQVDAVKKACDACHADFKVRD
ncbi:MAG TPA: cytochrome c [Rhizomicrobium sp.]|jgi:cytochrome c556